ncbi:hypothetical protein BJF79_13635 [Actinomadura sp. CNU-125]|nr:hypothetical protein BJF79_13635 [Actinomadura sp. CNU-125]
MLRDADGLEISSDRADFTEEELTHFARFDPARVLAEVEAKRQIVDIHEGLHSCGAADYDNADPCPTLQLLAQVYAGHPSYRKEWRP